jgi:cysteinyl-tRNA synthetase
VHNGFLSVESTKMSKSLGNFVTVHELLEQGVPGEAIRLALLSTHYRDPLDWTDERLQQAKQTLDRWYRALADSPADLARDADSEISFVLEDDLNTPLAISQLHEVAGRANRTKDKKERERFLRMLRGGGYLMGLLTQEPGNWFRPPSVELRPSTFVNQSTFYAPKITQGPPSKEYIEEQIAHRAKARSDRQFADADRIRANLVRMGIILEDRPDGTTDWRRA